MALHGEKFGAKNGGRKFEATHAARWRGGPSFAMREMPIGDGSKCPDPSYSAGMRTVLMALF